MRGDLQDLATLPTERLLATLIRDKLPGRIALVSSFGAEAAVLLHMVSLIAPETPVLFVDTGKHFGETRRYRDKLAARLGLKDLRNIQPQACDVQAEDSDGMLFSRDHDACCALRKIRPLSQALAPFEAWISGRKRYHGGARGELPVLESAADGKLKVNPLADWGPDRIDAYMTAFDLPAHPLVEDGYLSIGCMPCTDRAAPGENIRAGRWRGEDKTECGIHMPAAQSGKGLLWA